MKNVLILLLLSITVKGTAQALELRGGKSLFPAYHISLGYSHPTNSMVNLVGRVFGESANVNGLIYRSYGVDLLGQYNSSRADDANSAFSFIGGIGATCHLESEPWIYTNLSFAQRLNYGLIAEAEGEWLMTEVFGLSVFAQQKFLFHKALGTTRFTFGLGLLYHFQNN